MKGSGSTNLPAPGLHHSTSYFMLTPVPNTNIAQHNPDKRRRRRQAAARTFLSAADSGVGAAADFDAPLSPEEL